MRIAFASTGDYIDQHFGSARYWQIYDNEHFIEQRRTAAKCQGHCEGGFEHILTVLSDCEAVFVSKIGEGAAAYCINKGLRVFEARGEINEIIRAITNDPSVLRAGSETE